MKYCTVTLARAAFALLLMVFFLPACQKGNPPTTPDGGGEPVQLSPTAVPTRAPARSEPSPTPTTRPTTTPLRKIEAPIIWYLRGTAPEDLPRVTEQLNRILAARRFQAAVVLRIIDWAAFDATMASIQADNQAWDLVSLSGSSYPGWLEKGSLLPLTAYANSETGKVEDLLETRLPGLRASLPAPVWAGLRRSGEISAIPNQEVWARSRGFSIRADVVRALNLQADLDKVQSYADLTPLLAKVQAAVADGALRAGGIANGDKIQRAAGRADLVEPENAGYEVLWGPLVINAYDPGGAIQNWYQLAMFQDLAGVRRAWQQAGYLPDEPLTPEQASEGYRSGRYAVEVGHAVWPGSALEQAARYGYEWIDTPLKPSFLSTEAILSSLTGVNARIAGDPERVQRVMLFLEWLHTDPEIYNLLAYGIEGQHWQWRDREKQVITLAPGSRYRPDFALQLGNRTLSYATDLYAAGMWEAVRRENARAAASPALGFRFDPRPVAAEAAAVRGISMELEAPLANGQAENVANAARKLQKALEEAGLGTIQAALEEQYLSWK